MVTPLTVHLVTLHVRTPETATLSPDWGEQTYRVRARGTENATRAALRNARAEHGRAGVDPLPVRVTDTGNTYRLPK